MIKIKTHPNFGNWFNIFAFNKLVEQVHTKSQALKKAKELARNNEQSFYLHDGIRKAVVIHESSRT